MEIEFITPDKSVYKGETTAVSVPGSGGSFEILNNHAPIISSLDTGKVLIRNQEGDHYFEIGGGVVEVLQNHITLLAEKAEEVNA